MKSTQRKKNYYIPGIISLIIVPIAFIHFANRELKLRTQTVLTVYVIDWNYIEEHAEFFKQYHGRFPPIRNYIDINLTGNLPFDNIKLDFAQVRIKEILSQKDSTSGLHFSFGLGSEFKSFVKIIDMLKFEEANTFLIDDAGIWVYQFPPDPPDTRHRIISYDCFLCNDVTFIQPKTSRYTKAIIFLKNTWKSSWGIILSFLGFLSILLILRINHNGKQYQRWYYGCPNQQL